MSVSVTCKLNKSAKEMSSTNGTLFLVSLGKREFNRQTKEKEWVNYNAALFANERQVNFYREVLIPDAVITVSGSGLLPKIWGTNNDQISLDIIDSNLEFSFTGDSAPQQQAPQQQQNQQQAQSYQGAQQGTSKQALPSVFDDFDDSIPF
jgi:hypothetical protein